MADLKGHTMTIHIPDEVRKAALAELNNAFLGSMEDKMAAVLTAALQAWPGMHEKNIKATLNLYPGNHSIVLPIIRTEPRT
jgi:hypothetical protein